MRRALASLLISFLSVPVILPALLADPSQELPPCCRRDGKHHCSMAGMMGGESKGPALQSRCPLFPQNHSLPGSLHVSGFAVVRRVVGTAFSVCATRTSETTRQSQLLAGCIRKRGPPSFLN
jgi:hypothetical protein